MKIHLKCYEKKRLGSLEIFCHKANFHYFLVQIHIMCLDQYVSYWVRFHFMFFLIMQVIFVKCAVLEDYVNDTVSSLKQFNSKGDTDQESNIPSLAAFSSPMQLIIGYWLSASVTFLIDSKDLSDNFDNGLKSKACWMKILFLYKHCLLNLLTIQIIGMNSRITMVNGFSTIKPDLGPGMSVTLWRLNYMLLLLLFLGRSLSFFLVMFHQKKKRFCYIEIQ